jgi:hypothetical protein
MAIINTFSPSTTISSSQTNANNSDIADELTNSLALDGQSVMTGQVKAANGSASAPGYTFGSDLDTGFYRIGSNNIGAAVNGAKVLDIATTGLSITGKLTPSGQIVSSAGNAGTPGVSFTGDLDSGFYAIGANNIGLSLGGSKVVDYKTTGILITGTLGSSGDFAVNTNKFNVTASSGNTAIAGTLGVTGATSLAGLSTSGNASIGGTLTVAGQLKSSGNVVQVVDATPYTSNTTLSTGIPYDDTIPTSSEGDQILSASITPSSSSNTVRVRFNGFGTVSGSGSVCIAALFRGTTCVYVLATGANSVQANMGFTFLDAPATTSSTTYSIRVGSITGTSGIRMNGDFSSRLFGGKAACTMRLEEVQV